MTQEQDLRAVAGKALADPEFRQKLLDDPEAAVKEAGIELSDDELQALKEMDKEVFVAGIAELDYRLSMACWAKGRLAATPIEIPRVAKPDILPQPDILPKPDIVPKPDIWSQ